MKLNRLARSGQRQMVPVERANTGVIECLIVKTAKAFAARIIQPNPLLEPFLDTFLFLAGRFCRLSIYDRLLLLIEIIDCGCFEVESIFNEVETGITVGAPIGGVGGGGLCFPIGVDVPSSQRVNMSNFHSGRNV